MATVNWGGNEFTVYTMDGTTWNDVSGVYIFAGTEADGLWHAQYIGIADNFSNRLPNHERWAEARTRGATHVHALVVPQAATRQQIEQALIGHYQPYLNSHHR
jgi:predicted GIY-YIG superfamily endonuclease